MQCYDSMILDGAQSCARFAAALQVPSAQQKLPVVHSFVLSPEAHLQSAPTAVVSEGVQSVVVAVRAHSRDMRATSC